MVPARNEARNLPHVLGSLPPTVHQVILVDGHSVDDTVATALACRPDVLVVHQTRRGKGNALACGFAAVTGDIVVMLDADGSADAAEIPDFVEALVTGADFAKGTRFAPGGGSHDITRRRRWGNAFLNLTVNLLFGTRYTDLCYGYNAFWTDLLPTLRLPPRDIPGTDHTHMRWGDGFEIETLINVRVAAAGAVIREVPSVEQARLYGDSNLHAVRDGLRVLRTIVRERMSLWRRTWRESRLLAAQEAAAGRGPVDLLVDLMEVERGEAAPASRTVTTGPGVRPTARPPVPRGAVENIDLDLDLGRPLALLDGEPRR